MSSNWEQTRQECLTNIKQGIKLNNAVVKLYKTLKDELELELGTSFISNLNKLSSQLSEQKERLEKNQFEVSILGLEKAGKSSLLNGWLGLDILPHDEERCTYTTTKIHSSSLDDQRYELTYFTTSQFETARQQLINRYEELKAQGASSDNNEFSRLEKELAEIDECYTTIKQRLDQPICFKKFQSFEEVKEDLKDAIANAKHARAIASVTIYTDKLVKTDKDVIFYDVPGFDSPVKIHKDQAIAQLKKSDAILYAKKFATPSLTGPETDILDQNDSLDPNIRLGQKTLVALTQFDSIKTKDRYDSVYESNLAEWHNKLKIPKNRIIPVCAPIQIANYDQTAKEKIISEISILNNGDDGIDRLKKAMNDYIDNDRSEVVRQRCNKTLNDLKLLATDIFEKAKAKHGDSLVEAEKNRQEVEDDEFRKNWLKAKIKILNSFNEFFEKNILGKDYSDDKPDLGKHTQNLRTKYCQLVDSFFNNIEAANSVHQEYIYRRAVGDKGLILPEEGHLKIRNELFNLAIRKLDKMSEHITKEAVWEAIDSMLNEISKLFSNIPNVRSKMLKDINELTYQQELMLSIETLILRLARSTANLFLKMPRTRARLELIKTYQDDIKNLDWFYKEPDKDVINIELVSFLARGNDSNNPILKNHLSVKDAMQLFVDLKLELDKTDDLNQTVVDYLNKIKESKCDTLLLSSSHINTLEFEHPLTELKDIQKQIQDDIQAFQNYMKHSVYYAGGIEDFFVQELYELKRQFDKLYDEGIWENMIKSALRDGHRVEGFDVSNAFQKELDIVQKIVELKETLQSTN